MTKERRSPKSDFSSFGFPSSFIIACGAGTIPHHLTFVRNPPNLVATVFRDEQ